MAQKKAIIFSMIFIALIMSIEGHHLKYIGNQNLMKNKDLATNEVTFINVSPPIGDIAPPPSHDVGDFRPTTPGHSPGIGHSIHN